MNKERIIQLYNGLLSVFSIKSENIAVVGEAALVLSGIEEKTERLVVEVNKETFKSLSWFGFEVHEKLGGLGHYNAIEFNEVTIIECGIMTPTGTVDGININGYY